MGSGSSTRRRRILDVARSHFERFGFRRAVVDDMVRDVGIAKGSFYLEFRSKDALFRELVASLGQEREAALADAMSRHTSLADKLEAALTHLLESAATFPLLARLEAGDPEFLPHARRLGLEAPGAGSRQLRAVVEEALAAGELRPGLDVEAALSVLESLRGIARTRGVDAPPSRGPRFLEGISDLILHGLLTRGEGAGRHSMVEGVREPARPSGSPVSPTPTPTAVPEEPPEPDLPAQPPQRREQNDGWAEWEGS